MIAKVRFIYELFLPSLDIHRAIWSNPGRALKRKVPAKSNHFLQRSNSILFSIRLFEGGRRCECNKDMTYSKTGPYCCAKAEKTEGFDEIRRRRWFHSTFNDLVSILFYSPLLTLTCKNLAFGMKQWSVCHQIIGIQE